MRPSLTPAPNGTKRKSSATPTPVASFAVADGVDICNVGCLCGNVRAAAVGYGCTVAPCVIEVARYNRTVVVCKSNYIVLCVFEVIIFVIVVSKAENIAGSIYIKVSILPPALRLCCRNKFCLHNFKALRCSIIF